LISNARGVVGQKNFHDQIVATLPLIQETEKLTLSRRMLIGVTSGLHNLEYAFTAALHGEMSALEGITQKAGQLDGEFAEMIGGTKLAAEIRGGFDVATSIEEMAKFIGSGFSYWPALESSIQWADAAAEISKVAGKGGGGGGAGAGLHLNYYGPVVTDANSTQQLFDQWSQAVQNGTLDITSSRAAVQGPIATGRG
jgi:hypothetical protein